MKGFFKIVLATFVAIFIASIISILLFFGIVGVIVSSASSKSEVSIGPKSIFKLELSGVVVERSTDNPFASLYADYSNKPSELGLNDILSAIRKAKDNKNISGIYIDAGVLSAAPASLREIRQALLDFKASKKFIYAYGNMAYTQGAYYVASVADKIFLSPAGVVNWRGLSMQTTFYKEALNKLGIDMQVVRVGAYKSAVEPFINTKMSDANREQVTSFVGSIWNTLLDEVSVSRKLSVNQLSLLADKGMAFQPASQLVENHLVDSLLYDDQMKSFLCSKMKVSSADDLSFVNLLQMKNVTSNNVSSSNKIAVVYASGGIDMGESDGIDSEELAKTLAEVRTNDNIKAVIFRVNSPGGSAVGSELIWREVALMKTKKPVYVSMGDYAASGGYYISCAADTVFAQPNTITGSIGVFGVIPNVGGLTNKLGITFDGVKTNKMSDLPSVTRPFTPEERTVMQAYVNNTYDTFVSRCADGRRMTPDAVKKIAEGRVWTGEQAKKIGLVDELGTLQDAVKAIAGRAHLSDYNVVTYPRQKTFMERLMKGLNSSVQDRVEKAQLGDYYPYFKQLKQATQLKGVMASLPCYYVIE